VVEEQTFSVNDVIINGSMTITLITAGTLLNNPLAQEDIVVELQRQMSYTTAVGQSSWRATIISLNTANRRRQVGDSQAFISFLCCYFI
jgi:hypothetical protein